MIEKPPDELQFYPFAYALYNENLSTFCWYCLDEHKPHKRCVGCGTAIFCDKECQTLAWKDHKFECRGLKFNRNVVPDIEVRLLGRIVVRYKAILCGKDKDDATFYKDRSSRRAIMDIWAHTKNISEDSFAMRKFNAIYEALLNFYEAKALLSRDVIFQLHCRDFINRHAISDKAYVKEIGKGLYLDLCAYDHSCRPNTIYVCDGFKATLRPLNTATNLLDRSTTFYSYIDLLHAKQERRKLLKDTWYFHCECERCRDNQEHIITAMNCPHCTSKPPQRLCLFGDQPYKDPETQLLTCPTCGKPVPREAVVEALATMRFIDDVLDKADTQATGRLASIEFLEDLRSRVRRILPDINVYCCKIVQTLMPLIDPYDSETLLRLHLNVEECLRVCYPHNHPALGFHLRNIGIFALRLSNLKTAVQYLSEAADIFAFVMRDQHSMTITTREFLEDACQKLRTLRAGGIVTAAKTETERPNRRVMLRCEVFAESLDKGGVDESKQTHEAEKSGCNGNTGKFKASELGEIEAVDLGKKVETIDSVSDYLTSLNTRAVVNCNGNGALIGETVCQQTETTVDYVIGVEENVERNVELVNRREANAAAAGTPRHRNCSSSSPWKKRTFEYEGSLKRRSKKQTDLDHHHRHHDRRRDLPKDSPNDSSNPISPQDRHEHHHHKSHHDYHHHHSDNHTDQHLKDAQNIKDSEKLYESRSESVKTPNKGNDVKEQKQNSKDSTIPDIQCIIAEPENFSPKFETLFVDTSGALSPTSTAQMSAESSAAASAANRTGVKKKAALKKISPRARTPLPPFKGATPSDQSTNPTGAAGFDSALGSGLSVSATMELTVENVPLTVPKSLEIPGSSPLGSRNENNSFSLAPPASLGFPEVQIAIFPMFNQTANDSNQNQNEEPASDQIQIISAEEIQKNRTNGQVSKEDQNKESTVGNSEEKNDKVTDAKKYNEKEEEEEEDNERDPRAQQPKARFFTQTCSVQRSSQLKVSNVRMQSDQRYCAESREQVRTVERMRFAKTDAKAGDNDDRVGESEAGKAHKLDGQQKIGQKQLQKDKQQIENGGGDPENEKNRREQSINGEKASTDNLAVDDSEKERIDQLDPGSNSALTAKANKSKRKKKR